MSRGASGFYFVFRIPSISGTNCSVIFHSNIYNNVTSRRVWRKYTPNEFVQSCPVVYTQSGRTSSTLACHSEGRVFAPHSLQQVLRFVARICIVENVALGGTALCRVVGHGQSIESIVSDANVRSWLWLTATRGTRFVYFSSITAGS